MKGQTKVEVFFLVIGKKVLGHNRAANEPSSVTEDGWYVAKAIKGIGSRHWWVWTYGPYSQEQAESERLRIINES